MPLFERKGKNMQFTTQNTNKEVLINPASFKEAGQLKKAIMKELPKVLTDVDLSKISNLDMGIVFEKLSSFISNLDTSDEFESAVFDCLKSCIYDYQGKNLKITAQLFDDIPELREDYYEIVSKCCEVNLRPFFKSLYSELLTRFKMMPNADQLSI